MATNAQTTIDQVNNSRQEWGQFARPDAPDRMLGFAADHIRTSFDGAIYQLAGGGGNARETGRTAEFQEKIEALPSAVHRFSLALRGGEPLQEFLNGNWEVLKALLGDADPEAARASLDAFAEAAESGTPKEKWAAYNAACDDFLLPALAFVRDSSADELEALPRGEREGEGEGETGDGTGKEGKKGEEGNGDEEFDGEV